MQRNSGPWSDDEIRTLQQMKAAGRTYAEIGEVIGRHSEAVRDKWRNLSRTTSAQPTAEQLQAATAAMRDMRDAAIGKPSIDTLDGLGLPLWSVSNQVEQPKPAADYELSGGYDGDSVSMQDRWKFAETDAAERIKKLKEQQRWSINFNTNKPIAIAFASDQHIAPGTSIDFRRMREDAELVRDTPGMYAAMLGDGVDNHIKHRAAILSARSKPHDQYLLYEYYLSIFGPKLLAVVSGNHDLWTEQFAGIDMVSMLLRGKRVAYAPHQCRVEVNVGGQPYKIAMTHQFRMNSSFNPLHSHKQWLRLGEDEFDVGAIGHTHEAAIESHIYRGSTRWLIRPGSYQVNTAYGAAYGYNDSIPKCPTVILYPGQRRLLCYDDIREAAEDLKSRRARA